MTEKRPSRAFYWFYAMAILFGAAIVFWQTRILEKQKASFQWPVASGTILQSERTQVSGQDSNYRAVISYSYKVDGKSYVSDQISLWSSDLRSYDNRAFVSSHPAGATVGVYYNPTRPDNAVLIPGPNEKENELLAGWGGLCIVSGIWGMFRRLRRQPRLYALLNAPDAQTRTLHLRKADIEKGIRSLTINFLVAGGFMMFAAAFTLPQFLSGPNLLLEAPHPTHTWYPIAGAACALGFILFLARALQLSRSAQCPLCESLLSKNVFFDSKCNDCGTRIIFEGGSPLPNPETAQTPAESIMPMATSITNVRHSATFSEFQKDRFIDVAGFMAFPILFVWLWLSAGEHPQVVPVGLMTALLLGGAIYYFNPQITKGSARTHRSRKKSDEIAEGSEETGPYLLDFSVILFAPAVLLAYLLYLIWQHRALDTRSLIVVTIGFPMVIGVASYICYLRFTHARKIKAPKPPAFVPLTLLALWIVGTFISVVFLVCLIFKLGWLR